VGTPFPHVPAPLLYTPECDQCAWVNSLIQRGPTTFYLRAIAQKSDNLRATSDVQSNNDV